MSITEANELATKAAEAHPELEPMFYSGAWRKPQNIESYVLVDALLALGLPMKDVPSGPCPNGNGAILN
jgi:hypothetical protein